MLSLRSIWRGRMCTLAENVAPHARSFGSEVPQDDSNMKGLRWGRGRWRGRSRSLTASGIDQILQLFAGLEERDFLGGNFYALSGFRIAADAGFALAGAEAAKAADLRLVGHAAR